jgi:hypothetical protein
VPVRHIVVEIDLEQLGELEITKARIVSKELQLPSDRDEQPAKHGKVVAEINFYRNYHHGG